MDQKIKQRLFVIISLAALVSGCGVSATSPTLGVAIQPTARAIASTNTSVKAARPTAIVLAPVDTPQPSRVPTLVATPMPTIAATLAAMQVASQVPQAAQPTASNRSAATNSAPCPVTVRAEPLAPNPDEAGVIIQLTLTNGTQQACVIMGQPEYQLVDGRGQPLATTKPVNTASTAPLQPGQRGYQQLTWLNWCKDKPQAPFTLRVTLPGARTPLSVPLGDAQNALSIPRCEAQATSSTLEAGPIGIVASESR